MASSKHGFKQVLYWYKTEQPQSGCYRTRCAAAEPAIVAVMQSRVFDNDRAESRDDMARRHAAPGTTDALAELP